MTATLASLLRAMDATWEQLAGRLRGLDDAEYLWAPVDAVWTVRDVDGAPTVDFHKPDPEPAPVTTIAWRLWHVAVDCLDTYSERAFGTRGTGLSGTQWVGTSAAAVDLLERAWRTFRGEIARRGEAGLSDLLGDGWGPYADSTHLDLALHAHREVTHHAAEIALLRDLYRYAGDEPV